MWPESFDATIDEAAPEGQDWHPSIAGAQVFERLKAEQFEALVGFLLEIGPSTFSRLLATRSRSYKASAFKRAGAARFASATRAWADGDEAPMRRIALSSVEFVVDPSGTRRQMRRCSRDDLHYAAGEYGMTATRAAMLEAYLRAVASKLEPGQVVGDVFTEAQLTRLYLLIVGTEMPSVVEVS